MISYRLVQKESNELLYTVRSLVMVRNQLPAQVVKVSIIAVQRSLRRSEKNILLAVTPQWNDVADVTWLATQNIQRYKVRCT